jgi:hypothetical protein
MASVHDAGPDAGADAMTPNSPNSSSPLGLLSRTLVPCPLIARILPANIRHAHANDVAFIADDALHLYHFGDHARLRHVATKSRFSGRILAAAVFGDPRRNRFGAVPGSPPPAAQSLHSPQTHTAATHADSHADHVLPPEVLVLVLSSHTLAFVWAHPSPAGIPAFTHRAVKLPAATSRFDRLGTFLAVDPKHRAIAVAAHEGRFILYKTKSMQAWRDEAKDGCDTVPIVDERIIPIQGRIMHMAFLSAGTAQDDYHVVLLFVIVHHGMTRITCFDWDCRHDLSTVSARTERVVVDLGMSSCYCPAPLVAPI